MINFNYYKHINFIGHKTDIKCAELLIDVIYGINLNYKRARPLTLSDL